ncbi:hypothetical protein KKF81_06830 [Candidatus Micrarchaeota archaeon]|nr:hypothetical protein [Candidatus Micrarchaeota archaeon]MBU1166644.1 hypothetical protein [Candidatus Micrarchaeota archaeon]MBU1886601.1 hypothetical protein [Candidatus Micrarchaeota archaeon]
MFGLGTGKIDIQIQKYNYSPGESIQGKVILKVDKNTNAKGVFVEVYGEKKVTSGYGKDRRTRTMRIFEFKQPLDGEKEYAKGEYSYDFSIKIPSDVMSQPKIQDGILGAAIGAAQVLTASGSRVDWRLVANLDISMGLDVSKNIQLNIV